MNTAWLAHPGPIEIFLQPGDFYFGDAHTRIRTLLGSCVAITIWNEARKIGGMCHYMLPAHTRSGTQALDGRYADGAMALFMRELRGTATRPRDYQVKIFGGGRMFTTAHPGRTNVEALDVGRRNIETGRHLLSRQGFRVVAEHLGGEGHRNVIFDIATGEVWIRYIVVPPQISDYIMTGSA
ncbi:MAG: chemotaxis protein CheD [Rhodocyclales bacterium]|nr:chemotaxis protein CheD [Rhodocyclales bacterium]